MGPEAAACVGMWVVWRNGGQPDAQAVQRHTDDRIRWPAGLPLPSRGAETAGLAAGGWPDWGAAAGVGAGRLPAGCGAPPSSVIELLQLRTWMCWGWGGRRVAPSGSRPDRWVREPVSKPDPAKANWRGDGLEKVSELVCDACRSAQQGSAGRVPCAVPHRPGEICSLPPSLLREPC